MFKKETALGDDQAKPFDPMDVEFTFTETIAALRSNFKFLKTYAESVEAVAKMENEVRETLNRTAPQLMKEVKSNQANRNNYLEENALESIREDEQDEDVEDGGTFANEPDEYEDEENENYEDEEDEDSFNPDAAKMKKRQFQKCEIEGEEDNMATENRKRYDSVSHEQNADSNSEVEEGLILQPRVSKKDVSKDDEEFIKAFDMILTENIAVSNLIETDCEISLKY